MLVVIGIICLIAAVLTPSLLGQMGRARFKAAQLQLDTVASAVEAFHTDTGRYPTSVEGLTALLSQPAGADGWAGPYLRDQRLLNDPWNHPVRLVVDQDQTFSVQSFGADGKVGGKGTSADLRSPAKIGS